VLLEMDRGSIQGSEHLSSNGSVGRLDSGDEDDWASYMINESSIEIGRLPLKQGGEDSYLLENTADRRPVSTHFKSFVQCLHADLMRSQVQVLSASPDECMSTASPSTLSFSGFEAWVSRDPSTYVSLVRLLLPLLPCGVALASEEIDLVARGLSQRCGELRARMESRAQGTQRKQMTSLHASYAKVCHDFSSSTWAGK